MASLDQVRADLARSTDAQVAAYRDQVAAIIARHRKRAADTGDAGWNELADDTRRFLDAADAELAQRRRKR